MGILNLFKPNVRKMEEKRNVKGLVKALMYKKDAWFRICAAEALGRIGDTRAIEPLIQALKHEDYRVQKGAARVLEEAGRQSDDEIERAWYFMAKGKWGELIKLGKPSVEPLIQALKPEDADIRADAAVALCEIGDLRAAEVVIDYLISEPFRLHQDKSNLLGNYTGIILRAFGSGSDVHDDGGGKGGTRRYDLQKSVEAVGKLCNISTQISNNILHKISKRKDVTVSVGWGCEYSRVGSLSFESQRKMAGDELNRRGNPPYDPSVYLNKEAWKL